MQSEASWKISECCGSTSEVSGHFPITGVILQYADPKLTCGPYIYMLLLKNPKFLPDFLRLSQNDPLTSWSFCPSLKEIDLIRGRVQTTWINEGERGLLRWQQHFSYYMGGSKLPKLLSTWLGKVRDSWIFKRNHLKVSWIRRYLEQPRIWPDHRWISDG